jgi:hypothetical protein
MSKDSISIKSNGLRNELKGIRKSIDALTNALIELSVAQTHLHYEKNNNCKCNADDNGMCACQTEELSE